MKKYIFVHIDNSMALTLQAKSKQDAWNTFYKVINLSYAHLFKLSEATEIKQRIS